MRSVGSVIRGLLVWPLGSVRVDCDEDEEKREWTERAIEQGNI